jgi:hypothetical protein
MEGLQVATGYDNGGPSATPPKSRSSSIVRSRVPRNSHGAATPDSASPTNTAVSRRQRLPRHCVDVFAVMQPPDAASPPILRHRSGSAGARGRGNTSKTPQRRRGSAGPVTSQPTAAEVYRFLGKDVIMRSTAVSAWWLVAVETTAYALLWDGQSSAREVVCPVRRACAYNSNSFFGCWLTV